MNLRKQHKSLAHAAVYYDQHLSRIMVALVVVTAVSVFLYGTFLLEAVAHAATRTSAERQIRSLTQELGSLEGKYLSQTQSLTPAKAQALGLVTPAKVDTVYAGKDAASLSFVSR